MHGANVIANEPAAPAALADDSPVDLTRIGRTATSAAPVGWDYHTLVIPHGAIGGRRDEIDRSELDGRLADLGRLGWELMYVSFNQRMHLERDGHLMIFKRPIHAAAARERETTVTDGPSSECFPGMD